MKRCVITTCLSLLAGTFAGLPAGAEPVRGGVLKVAVSAEPNTLDCHAATSFADLHSLAPHYSTLLKFDPATYPAVTGDVAESWTVSEDGMSYRFRLRGNVRFHDGSRLTARDVVASLERIRNPPDGILSGRKNTLERVAAFEAPDPLTVLVRLSKPEVSLLPILANPFNCLYSADKLAADPHFPEKTILGTGPFRFTGRVLGGSWDGERFDNYFIAGQPYLDGFRNTVMSGTAMLNALQSGQIDAEFRSVSPPQRDRIVAQRGDTVTVRASPWLNTTTLAFNTEKPPFNDERVRRALSLALDRDAGSRFVSRISIIGPVGGLMRPGYALAATAEELRTMTGFGPDMEARRREAVRLLAEAGVPNLAFTLSNRNIGEPYATLGNFLIDQWRRIGVTATADMLENAAWVNKRASGAFDAIIDAWAEVADDPTLNLIRYNSFDRSSLNTARYIDRELDDLYNRQREQADPAKRKELLRAFEQRFLDKSYFAPLFWGQRTVVTSSKVQGWVATPSMFVNQDLASIWLAP